MRTRATRPTGNRRLRLGSALLALVAFAAPLGGAAHLSAVRHVACLEHGGLVHVGNDAALHAPLVARGGDALDAAAAEHAHQHCTTPALRRDDAALAALPSASTPDAAPSAPAIIAAAGPSRPIVALYRLAPKNSPPRA